MKVLNNKEMELKYSAAEIYLTDFQTFAHSMDLRSSLYVCGYDTFFHNPNDTNTFIRHRIGDDFNQLTVKRKLTEKNNFIRDEINVSLDKDTSEETVQALAKTMGYEFNCRIFKTVFVYNYDKFTLAYYTVTDTNLEEMGRFMEIEMSETYPWESEKQAWDLLTSLEAKAGAYLGVKPQNRIRKSLFEQFRKEIK